jgi:hypothetical protein
MNDAAVIDVDMTPFGRHAGQRSAAMPRSATGAALADPRLPGAVLRFPIFSTADLEATTTRPDAGARMTAR